MRKDKKLLINNHPRRQEDYWQANINLKWVQIILSLITMALVIYFGLS